MQLSTLLFSVSCNNDDDQSNNSNSSEITIGQNLPNSIAFNTGNVPLFPEGITFDLNREAFIVSSALTGALTIVDQEGNISELVPASTFGGNGTLGLEIDQANDRLLAVSTNLQNRTIAKLYIFTLSSGSLLHEIDLAALTPGLSQPNDVTVDPSGNAYVTNSDQGVIYKVDMEGNVTLFFNDPNFAPADPANETGFNGIAYHDNGYLILSYYETNTLYKLPLNDPTNITPISAPAGYISGGDGIALNGNELVVVSNVGVPFATKFISSDDFESISVVGDTYATGDVFPTTVVNVGNDFMINNSYFNFPAYGDNPVDYLITKASFDQSARFSGSSSEIPRVNTPVVPAGGYGADYPSYFYADCTTPISSGIPDMQGDWVETTVTIAGVEYAAATENTHQERIEQCGERILIISEGVLHEVYLTDNTMYNGVNDINPQGQPIHSTGEVANNTLTLTPRFPLALDVNLPNVTRELLQDDEGNDVLRFFNPLIGRVVYMRR